MRGEHAIRSMNGNGVMYSSGAEEAAVAYGNLKRIDNFIHQITVSRKEIFENKISILAPSIKLMIGEKSEGNRKQIMSSIDEVLSR